MNNEWFHFESEEVRNRFLRRITIEFALLFLLLAGLGFMLQTKVVGLLNASLEESLARRAEDVSLLLESRFHMETAELEKAAAAAAVHPEDIPVILEHLKGDSDEVGVFYGRERFDTERAVNCVNFPGLVQVFLGYPTTAYSRDYGIVFAVPIMRGSNVQGVFYRFYKQENLAREFSISRFNRNAARFFVCTDDNTLVMPYEIYSGDATGPFFDDANYDGFVAVGEMLKTTKAAARYYDGGSGRYFLMSADLSHTHLRVLGYVPWEAVAGDQFHIYDLVLSVFVLMMVIFVIISMYLFYQQARAEESDELRRAKSAAEDARRIADDANRAKSEFLANMSHEIRTPINAVLGLDEMILRETKDAQTRQYAKDISSAGKSLLGLVNDILDFSKIAAGKMDIIPVEYSIGSVINDLINLVHARAEAKGLEFKLDIDSTLPSILKGDEVRVKQVITNLLTNAVKYTEKGSITLGVHYERKTEKMMMLIVSVKDTGIGIKEEDNDKLFNAFERIEEERNRTIEGTGLGMNITKQLLKLMYGWMGVDSVYGEGSTFTVHIPQEIVSEVPLGDFDAAYASSLAKVNEYEESFKAPDARILIVDDTPMNLEVAKGLLKQTEIHIDTAESGQEALVLMAQNDYDVVFLDHRMPQMDGIETLANFLASEGTRNKNIPMISLTANAVSGAREMYIKAGFTDYLTKPINSSQLEAMLMQYLPKDKIQKITAEKITEEQPHELLPDWLYSVGDIHPEVGLANCGGAEEYLATLKIFYDAISEGHKEISQYFDEKDWKNYTVKVHALKSTARIIGAEELSERAMRLEDAGNAGYIEEIERDTEALLALYDSFREKLEPLGRKEEDESEKPLIGEKELDEAVEAIREMAESFDDDSISFIMEELTAYRMPEDKKEWIEELRKAAGRPDWDKVKELLERKA
ncbi:MAG: response regulator [Schwartzia sp.]|nr:response regulator [Schwartzia sp. (in: firmicutes)]